MKIIIILFFILALFFQACDPPSDCTNTNPKCIDSPILLKLKADLSSSASTFHIGDTLKLSLKIPDTLNTNQGIFYLSSVQNVELAIDYYSSNSFGDSTKVAELSSIIVSKGTGRQNNRLLQFKDNRELELLFVFAKKTNSYIGVSPQSQRLVLTDKSGGKYLFMLNVAFNISDGHRDLYLSWLPYNKQQAVAAFDYSELNGFGYFCFKVE